MLVLDSDHLTELGFQSVPGQRLSKRLGRSDLPAVIPIVAFQEQMAGMISRINQIKSASVGELILAYKSLANVTDFLTGFTRIEVRELAGVISNKQEWARAHCRRKKTVSSAG